MIARPTFLVGAVGGGAALVAACNAGSSSSTPTATSSAPASATPTADAAAATAAVVAAATSFLATLTDDQRAGISFPIRPEVSTGSAEPAGYDLVVNATPIGMDDDDPLPIDVDKIAPGTFVGEVVMRRTITPLLQAAQDKGCPIQVGSDMLFEQIPAYLEFFGLGTATPHELRAVAQIPT